MRGQHFGFLTTLCVVWVIARVGFLAVLSTDIAPVKAPRPMSFSKTRLPTPIPSGNADTRHRRSKMLALRRFRTNKVRTARRSSRSMNDIAFIKVITNPDLGILRMEPTTRPLPVARSGQPALEQPSSRLNVYAYSFFRQGSGGGIFPGTGQYGGSQSGFVATYALDSSTPAGLSVLIRGAVAHDRLAERELAAGLRWQPVPRIPLTLTAERRFRHARSDAFAIYLAGGKSQVALPLDFRLDTFAQGGFVSGKEGGPFFDVTSRAERELLSIGNAPVTVGTGIWGGGQKGIFRVDAGPTIGTAIPIGTTRLRVNADWRLRIAGEAAPASGPALTLSTSF